MDERFDILAKALADSLTRRGVLRRVWGGALGALLAPFGFGQQAGAQAPKKDCKKFCKDSVPEHYRKQCEAACQSCGGQEVCGRPGALVCCAPGTKCCPPGVGGVCTDVSVDPNNCGACGTARCREPRVRTAPASRSVAPVRSSVSHRTASITRAVRWARSAVTVAAAIKVRAVRPTPPV